jgi:hypothetical protein
VLVAVVVVHLRLELMVRQYQAAQAAQGLHLQSLDLLLLVQAVVVVVDHQM